MSGRGVLRRGKGKTHRPKRPGKTSGLSEEALREELEEVGERRRALLQWIYRRADRVTGKRGQEEDEEEGNSSEAIRLHDFLAKREGELHRELQERCAKGGAASSGGGTQLPSLGAG